MKHKISDRDIEKMNLSDWAKYLNESIYVIWFEILCITISKYPTVSKNLMQYSRQTIHFIKKKLHHLKEGENIYRKMFEACGKVKLPEEARILFEDMRSSKIEADKVTMGTYFQALTNNSNDRNRYISDPKVNQSDAYDAKTISLILDDIYIDTQISCQNTTCNYFIWEEELMTGWEKSKNSYISQCPKCKAKFVPYF